MRCATRMGYDVKMDVEKDVAYEAKKGRGVADPMTACYVNSNFPAMLYFAYKYAEDPQEALLANANAGGECVARGALLGAVVGAAHGMEGWKRKKRSKLDIIGGLTESEKLLAKSTPLSMSFPQNVRNVRTGGNTCFSCKDIQHSFAKAGPADTI